jgi:Mg2+-importing ATPase
MSVVVALPGEAEGKCELITKGAAQVVLERCSHIRHGDRPADIVPERGLLTERINAAAEAGNTVLAVAVRSLSDCRTPTETDEQDLTLLGFLMLADPIRPGVEDVMYRARRLGLDVKIVTGDAVHTATALARTIGLPTGKDDIVVWSNLRDGERVPDVAERAHVFAEVNPEDKYRLVRALQQGGHRVAVTGDGINDAPALKVADVGIAMQSGTDVAKDASDLILLENDLGVIVDALREGRRIFVNLNRYLLYTMAGNFSTMLIVAVASQLLDFLPLLPAQVLLLNFLTDLPMLAVATDRVPTRQIARPLHWDIRPIVDPAIYLGLLNALFAFGFLRFFQATQPDILRTSWYLFLVVSTTLLLFPVRSKGPFWKDELPSVPLLLATTGCLVIGILLAEIPFSQALFGFAPLPVTMQLAIFGYSLVYLLLADILLLSYYTTLGQRDRQANRAGIRCQELNSWYSLCPRVAITQ